MAFGSEFERERRIMYRLLAMDVDGTLTDGREAFLPGGESLKFFHHHDMHCMKMALRAGLRVGLLSARDVPANRRMTEDLHLTFLLAGATDKVAGFEEILRRYDLSPDECLYMGDDVVDMPVIRRAGIGVAVGDAVPELDEVARWRTSRPGGRGAAEEVIRRVLKEKNLFDAAMERYRR